MTLPVHRHSGSAILPPVTCYRTVTVYETGGTFLCGAPVTLYTTTSTEGSAVSRKEHAQVRLRRIKPVDTVHTPQLFVPHPGSCRAGCQGAGFGVDRTHERQGLYGVRMCWLALTPGPSSARGLCMTHTSPSSQYDASSSSVMDTVHRSSRTPWGHALRRVLLRYQHDIDTVPGVQDACGACSQLACSHPRHCRQVIAVAAGAPAGRLRRDRARRPPRPTHPGLVLPRRVMQAKALPDRVQAPWGYPAARPVPLPTARPAPQRLPRREAGFEPAESPALTPGPSPACGRGETRAAPDAPEARAPRGTAGGVEACSPRGTAGRVEARAPRGTAGRVEACGSGELVLHTILPGGAGDDTAVACLRGSSTQECYGSHPLGRGSHAFVLCQPGAKRIVLAYIDRGDACVAPARFPRIHG